MSACGSTWRMAESIWMGCTSVRIRRKTTVRAGNRHRVWFIRQRTNSGFSRSSVSWLETNSWISNWGK